VLRDVPGHRLRRDATAEVAWLGLALRRDLVDHDLGVRDLAHRARIRLRGLELHVAARRVRLAEIERRGRLEPLAAAERDAVADHGAHEQAGRQEPPARAEQPRVPAEVDLLLRLGIEGGGHPAATLAEAQAHIASNPSASDVLGDQPSAVPMRVTSAFVRATSPFAEETCRTSSVRPETRSSSSIASSMLASSPPPTL